jgi:5-methylcytosine-specific restriction endonuclease McrA
MTKSAPALRTCRDCKREYLRELATRCDGERSLRGFYCPSCGIRRAREYEELLRQRELNIARNLWAAYRGWWKHFTPPRGWAKLLRTESENCPYCGRFLTDDPPPRAASTAVIDHMDPLSLGGEDSLRNAVFCCNRCNGIKKNKPFVRWLSELSVPFQENLRALYLFKHEHQPEAFETGPFEFRVEGIPLFLELDEREFKRELRGMLPLADGPPATYLLNLLKPDPGPISIQSMICRPLLARSVPTSN